MSKDNTKGFATLVKEISQFAEERESGRLSQLIFATSMIAPELNTEEYVIGDYYTEDNKSLKHVNN